MSILDLILRRQPKTASLAKERLQVIIAREGSRSANPELIQQIKQAVIEAVSRYVKVAPEDIAIDLDSDRDMEVLSVSVTLADTVTASAKPRKAG
ncbi:cell division topological specificity factor MinE [Quisquiliibacterium transsilvanicum]|jgi:cell division topological specificity factor|uniref:Cell division topological specificity factor n=1 Tax=Quisquiliibacterium transsilvanicum TaxID=1549638 RepID=A0A7W8HKI4_9BURK|nr:cell division topological specificity factor MinE [Quisquiliibacterium transsilvanicum]MBB5273648.1 cell division topological specificity factor [Quisquiliibacterium transsilvanicum]